MKKFKCKNETCGKGYEKRSPLQRACSPACEKKIVESKKSKKEARLKEAGDKTKATYKAWLESAQTVCNSFIRMRDKELPCISCGCKMVSSGNGSKRITAGHLFSVGGHSAVRFDEDNIHGQCFECNASSKFDAGKYIEEMIKRTSEVEFEVLRAKAYEPKKWEVSELKAIQSYYLTKIKELLK